MSITIEQLNAFCNTERPIIMRPFSQDIWTYATDGKLIIRVPRMAEVPEYDDSPKKLDSFIWGYNPITENWFKIPSGLSNEPNRCEQCVGSGECHRCECGDVHDCGFCDGSGNGKETAIAVGNQWAGHLLLNRLSALPNVEICNSAKDKLSALGIRFDGGEGRLMPIKKEP